jgi:hypothetical protein
MLARTSLILTLIVSLLFVGQAQKVIVPVEMKEGGACAAMKCVRGCCNNATCCTTTEQQQAPQIPTPATPGKDLQLATIGLRARIAFFAPPAPRQPFVIRDESSTAHTLSPLAASCIRLI